MLHEGVNTIADVDRGLAEWVSQALPSVAISFELAKESAEGSGISLYLLSIEQAPGTQGRKPIAQLALRYLVTAWGNEPLEVHRILGELAFSAMEHPRLELEWVPLPCELWAALQLRPQPAVVVRTQLSRVRALPDLPTVRSGLTTRDTKLRPMSGVVLGADSLPVPHAAIEVASLKLSTRSDAAGRFRFPALPVDLRPTFNVEAKGRKVTVNSLHAVGSGKPLVIHLEELEL